MAERTQILVLNQISANGLKRLPAETFVNTVKRVGIEPFKTAANAVRVATARTPVAA